MKKFPKYKILNTIASLIILLSLIISMKFLTPGHLLLAFCLFFIGFTLLSIAQHEEDEYQKYH